VTASRLAEVPRNHLSGVISAEGSSSSHVAILARSMGIPTVMGITGLPLADLENKKLVLDGYNGRVYISPSQPLQKEFIRLIQEEKELYAGLEELRDLPPQTPDGHHLPLHVNMGLMADIPSSINAGASGIGLYRTEVPFMIRDRFPSEEEQRMMYRSMLEAFAPRPVTMRTLDIGGDKNLPYFPVEEDNPFLGWRGIRITLDHPELFLVQLRAMLRAASGLNNLQIMLPMVSSLSEIIEAQRLLAQAYAEVTEEGTSIIMPKIGVMIEVPSAVYQARRFAERVDFLSVGSNDLTQYLLAVDRNNARVANLYDVLHPAVLLALQTVVQSAHAEHKPANICGEMAGDPAAAILLLGLGFNVLSMNATSIAKIKWVIRNFSLSRAEELVKEALLLHDGVAIRHLLEDALDQAGLGGLIRAGKGR
jgi:phosphotransferase system, enzyme I, PtsP